MQRTLKRESKELEIADTEAVGFLGGAVVYTQWAPDLSLASRGLMPSTVGGGSRSLGHSSSMTYVHLACVISAVYRFRIYTGEVRGYRCVLGGGTRKGSAGGLMTARLGFWSLHQGTTS